ncbi:hypothetical protein Poli38472_006488 [Pythium oligandrum]|uniref:Glutathione S-transferase 3, mitochondrial n=1 Tax=Pythium oligandrum TaxID=41045 RepID=A0A8K1C4X2_PYTOL|nr:hypothetical protein Poli38472_006488 [Pythium oligandrum]|eukprot:TMW56478.1 hypothetical protein Poli38472_006488 [Pythium oligandrum]
MTFPVMQPEHGYVVLLLAPMTIIHVWAGMKVVKARKLYNVPLPQMYADKDNKHAREFNCVQRAHQNTLEHMPLFLATLVASSLYRPGLAAMFGLIRELGFIVYIRGYSTGEPKKRMAGSFGYIAMLGGFVLTVEAGLKLLNVM